MTGLRVVWLLLGQSESRGVEGEGEPAYWLGPDEEALHYGVSLEVSGLALLPRMDTGSLEGYAQVEPTLILDGAERFGLNAGAPLRLVVARGTSSARTAAACCAGATGTASRTSGSGYAN
ncbi:hypothetical protein [Myxococcus sp. RHSTA-1-4]|uniref:hypothetical protein n=1 Tax=Myxococcus sp. RHSTA-1-4 TaxID=2874601 RepID=UPI001CC0D263|nr:hypothetical protein [Myxococcus sp. RHSTA-1-4]